jgi:hypothetical protein
VTRHPGRRRFAVTARARLTPCRTNNPETKRPTIPRAAIAEALQA